MEVDHENLMPTEQVEEQTTDSVEAIVEENVEVHGIEGITIFSEDYIKGDPGLRIPLDSFAPNIRDDVRFAYIRMGATQPTSCTFPPNRDGRCFRPQWYKDFVWLEYSVTTHKAYCFCCYLFKHDRIDDKFGHDVFSKLDFDCWKNAVAAFRKHVGGPCSIHNISKTACDDFKNQGASVKSKVTTYSQGSLVKYETRVDTSLGIVSYLALQGEPFRGHDESSSSLNKGNFLELLDWVKERIPEVKVAFDELCPQNAKMTSGTIQKELVKHCATAVTTVIKEEMGDCLFTVLIDECRDISVKEQMAVVVRYVSTSSCKRKDKLLDKQKEDLLDKIERGEMPTGRGKNQETSLVRPGDTRWGSHYTTLSRIESMWDAVIEVLGIVEDDVRVPCRAGGLVHQMETFSFVFILKMMLKILRITNDLSLLLQKKDQNVVQAMSLVTDVRTRLVNWRNDGWEPLLEDVKVFCTKNDIPIPSMDDIFTKWGKSRKGGRNNVTADHFFRVDTFYAAIDSITTEFDHRFNEVSSELLQNFSCLDPRNSFSRFNLNKLARLTEIYHDDFSDYEREHIEDNLDLFIIHMRRIEDFRACHDIASLAKMMVELERHVMFPTVYRLIELALLLPVATATVERAFSSMKIIKTELHSKMTDGWLNDLMVCYIEREIFKSIDLGKIKQDFQNEGRALPLPGSSRRH
ncbi:hypothetical protein VPH35_132281 [Triticum aestivum]